MMGAPDADATLDVKLIMPLVIKDPNTQLSLLKAMMNVIQDGELLEHIRASHDKAEIISSLQMLEEASD